MKFIIHILIFLVIINLNGCADKKDYSQIDKEIEQDFKEIADEPILQLFKWTEPEKPILYYSETESKLYLNRNYFRRVERIDYKNPDYIIIELRLRK